MIVVLEGPAATHGDEPRIPDLGEDHPFTLGRVPADRAFAQLRTDRLIIRPFRPKDIEAFVGYRSDPEVARYQSWDMFGRSQAESFVAHMATLNPGVPGQWFQFAVADRSNDDLLGDTAICLDAEDPSRAELGYTFAAASQGKGYATEAVRATIEYAFERLGVDVVVAVTDARNARSIALLDRIGMTHVSTAHMQFKGEWCDELTYEQRRRRS
jgi:RimJ/RimL family protein N-acetyltransferase